MHHLLALGNHDVDGVKLVGEQVDCFIPLTEVVGSWKVPNVL